MEGELLNTAVNVLRIFTRCADRGNNLTFHLDDLHNDLCRGMCRTKKKDREKLRVRLIAVLNACVSKKLLFLSMDDWSDDILPKSKKKEKKRVYGLTDSSIQFLELQKAAEFSLESADCIKRLLARFELTAYPVEEEPQLQTQPAQQQVVAEVTAQTKQDEPDTNTDTPMTTNSNNKITINDIIDILIKESESKQTVLVPAQLLADLVRADATSADNYASSRRLDWTTGSYRKAIRVLNRLGLIASAVRNVPTDGGAVYERAYGIWLTELGRRVAEEGDFTTNYPRVTRVKKKGPHMIADKGAKKRDASRAPTETQTVYGRVTRPDGTEMVIYDRDLARQLMVETSGETPPTTSVPPRRQKFKTLGTHKTIGSVVKATIGGFCESLVQLSEPGNTPKTADINAVNLPGVYCAITELEVLLTGMKRYIGNCNAQNEEIDLKKIADYNALIALQCDAIEHDKALSAIYDPKGQKIPGSKSYLTGDAEITRDVMDEQLV